MAGLAERLALGMRQASAPTSERRRRLVTATAYDSPFGARDAEREAERKINAMACEFGMHVAKPHVVVGQDNGKPFNRLMFGPNGVGFLARYLEHRCAHCRRTMFKL